MTKINRNILITGATGGIGSALSTLLKNQGCHLVLTCFDNHSLEKLKEKIGDNHTYVQADINNEKDRKRIVAACHTNHEIDAVINLAGILDFNLFEQQTEEMVKKIVEVNMISPMLLCHDLLPLLRKRKSANIINVGSIFGSIGHPGFVAYCASKAGVKCFSEALSRELGDTSIHVSYIAPRATKTPLNSNKVNELNQSLGNKSDTPEYVATEIMHMLSSKKHIKYLGWPEKLFVRINSIFPDLVHKSLVQKLDQIKSFAK